MEHLTQRVLRRIDYALGARHSGPGGNSEEGEAACPQCREPLGPAHSIVLRWCEGCRGVFACGPGQLVCYVPVHWIPERLLQFWERGIMGLSERASDHSFTRFFCARMGIDPLEALDRLKGAGMQPDLTRIGRHALEHRMLTRTEVAWVLRFQRAARAHRRRCFGEIAVTLGFWEPEVVPRLLAAQAERRRGVVPAIVHTYRIASGRLLLAEQAFFGFEPNGAPPVRQAPFDLLMAA